MYLNYALTAVASIGMLEGIDGHFDELLRIQWDAWLPVQGESRLNPSAIFIYRHLKLWGCRRWVSLSFIVKVLACVFTMEQHGSQSFIGQVSAGCRVVIRKSGVCQGIVIIALYIYGLHLSCSCFIQSQRKTFAGNSLAKWPSCRIPAWNIHQIVLYARFISTDVSHEMTARLKIWDLKLKQIRRWILARRSKFNADQGEAYCFSEICEIGQQIGTEC